MGTLTAGQTRLASYCAHKLPTSCRLSSISECCACADDRSHAAAYSTYIDGVGYVLRGSRWQRYCWFCKEFWENRVRASGLSPSQTRIPQEPDQAAFLDRWYEFHQGYRIITKSDGTEERVTVVGEDFRDVSPGCMPRTIEELRAGIVRSPSDAQAPVQPQRQQASAPTISLDDQLDSLFNAAVAEDTAGPAPSLPTSSAQVTVTSSNIPAQAMSAPITPSLQNQARRVASLRRELYRMRNGIERVIAGLRELGAIVPDHNEATERLGNLGRALGNVGDADPYQEARLAIGSVNELARSANATNTDRAAANLQSRIEEARERAMEAQRMRNQAASELEQAERELAQTQSQLHGLQREQRTFENYTRIFGTREDMAAQGENYESPIGGMFTRAWERFREAEDVRREERTLRQYLADEQATGGEEQVRRLVEIENMSRDVWGVPQSQSLGDDDVPTQGLRHAGTSNTTQLMEMARNEVFGGQQALSQTTVVSDFSDQIDEQIQEAADRRFRQGLLAPTDLVGHRLFASRAGINHSPVYELTDENLREDLRLILEQYTTQSATVGLANVATLFEDFSGEDLRVFYSLLIRDEADLHDPIAEQLLADDEIVWNIGLPQEWFRRSQQDHHPLSLTTNATSDGREEQRQNIEAMARAFRSSPQIRRMSGIHGSAQLQMLYRLQRGARSATDRTVLWNMLNTATTVAAAREVLAEDLRGPTVETQRRMAHMVRSARDGMLDEGRRNAVADLAPAAEDESVGLDANDDRPEAKTDEEMTVKMDCGICYTQVADTACLPCGHLVMCRWCADQHSPTYGHDRTRPRRPAHCPVCRKHIKQKVRVIRV